MREVDTRDIQGPREDMGREVIREGEGGCMEGEGGCEEGQHEEVRGKV